MTEIIHNFEKVHKKDLETITQVLVKITHRSPEEIKPHLDIMLEHLITPKQETATRENCSEIFLRKKPLDPVQWQADMKALAQRAEEIPVLPEEAFTRKSMYGDHD